MSDKAYLVLQDGSTYKGIPFGSTKPTYGEVVFNTSMTGYQEMLTDPSYAGQIVMPTYPMMGNYGINRYDNESQEIQVAGFVVRQFCEQPSHANSTSTIEDFLSSYGISGISEVDTRSITRRIRRKGVMMGTIISDIDPEEALIQLKQHPTYDQVNYVNQVTSHKIYRWDQPRKGGDPESPEIDIFVSDFGLKYNILRMLRERGCRVTVYPSNTAAEDLLERNPDGILLSPGPGDPNLLDYTVTTAKLLLGRVPLMGICLGNQILARALGGKVYKLKFGHRGSNHPVKEQASGRIHITSQNHGYSIDADSLPSEVEVSHLSMNDHTVEGIRHKSLPAMSIQYHSEASPGPRDNGYIFNQFLEMVREAK